MRDFIAQYFDHYSRVARLRPALLALAPVVWTVALLKPESLTGGVLEVTLSALATFGVLHLFAVVARARGKAIEPILMAEWGGWRTTGVLRHRDTTINPYTKARYHAALEKLCAPLTLPNAADEAANPQDSDHRYRSATERLLELRRDAKYELLHKENRLYGFRRNLLGLKPVAIGLMALLTAVPVIVWWHALPGLPDTLGALLLDIRANERFYAAVAVNAAYLLIWVAVVRQGFVLQAANEYALALFRTLDE